MAERPITIHSVCQTTPDQHVHVRRGDNVRWHADHTAIYVLHIPGGFFQGEPNDFFIWVVSGLWTRDYTVAGAPGNVVANYIYNLQGTNCLPDTQPPDIIIDSSPFPHRKKKAPASRKKTAPSKKKK